MLFTPSKFAALVALAFAAGAQAQIDTSLITGLSGGCGQALIGLLANQEITSCLALTDAVTAIGSAQNGSIVPGLDNYFKNDICSKPACSNATLSSATQNIASACAEDIQKGGIPAVIVYLMQNYDTVRNLGCLQDDGSKELCLVQTMYAVQNATGAQLSFQTLQGLLSGGEQAQQLAQVAQNQTVLCTACNDALFTTLQKSMSAQGAAAPSGGSSSSSSSLVQSIGTQAARCNANGVNFTDGQIPSNIKQTAQGNSTSSSSSGSGSGSGSGNSGSSSGGQNAAAGFKVSNAAAVSVALGLVASGLAVLF